MALSVDAEHILELNARVSRAYLERDVAGLSELFDEHFVFTNPLGEVLDRDQELAQVQAGNLECDSFETRDVTVRLHGPTAIVFGSAIVRGRYQGRDMGGHYRFTRVFVNRDGRWTLAAAQGTKRPER